VEDLLKGAATTRVLGKGFVAERLDNIEPFAAFLARVFVSRHACLIPGAKTNHDIKPCGNRLKPPSLGPDSCNRQDCNMLRPCSVPLVFSRFPI
jgi:hypothetical protein